MEVIRNKHKINIKWSHLLSVIKNKHRPKDQKKEIAWPSAMQTLLTISLQSFPVEK